MGLNLVALFAKVAEPFIPFSAETIAGAVGEPFPGRWPETGGTNQLDILSPGRAVKAPEVLFRKVEDGQVAEWLERLPPALREGIEGRVPVYAAIRGGVPAAP